MDILLLTINVTLVIALIYYGVLCLIFSINLFSKIDENKIRSKNTSTIKKLIITRILGIVTFLSGAWLEKMNTQLLSTFGTYEKFIGLTILILTIFTNLLLAKMNTNETD